MQRNADIGRPTIQRIKAMSLKTRKTTLSRKKKKTPYFATMVIEVNLNNNRNWYAHVRPCTYSDRGAFVSLTKWEMDMNSTWVSPL